MKNLPQPINQWVNDNNPSVDLSYSKGWWDYIETIQVLSRKFDVSDVSVISTYVMETPPPTEELTMPVFKLRTKKTECIIKLDFGSYPDEWTVSLHTSDTKSRQIYNLFDQTRDLRNMEIDGFKTDWIFTTYSENPAKFTCELRDVWDLATFLRIFLKGFNNKQEESLTPIGPNEITREAIRNAKSGKNLKSFYSVKRLFLNLKIEESKG